ncbi:UNVERIFIED_CONTAM: hypothetical protein DES50_101564 [Williamsia faeni]
MNQVLGISVTDLEIASVVADSDTGEVLARNFVELPSSSPDHVFDAIYQLVQSAPIVPSAITIACADSATTLAIGGIINSGQLPAEPGVAPTTPDWFARTTVVGSPVAYAEIAAVLFGARGVVLVADLDRSGALFPGQSVALVDTDTRVVVGASEISGVGVRPPVTEPDGAQLLADAVGVIGNPTGALQGIAVLGPGAAIPGVAPSLEYALQLPVQVTEDGQYAAAYGAARVAASTTVVRGNNSRWVLLSAAAAAALLVAIGVVAAVVMTGDSSIPKSAVDDHSTTQSTTSTTTTTTTSKKSTPRPTISSPTLPPETTQAPVTTEEPPVVTVVPPPTTITQTPPPPPPPSSTTTSETPPSSTGSTTTTTTPSVEPSPPDDAANPPAPGAGAPPESGAE